MAADARAGTYAINDPGRLNQEAQDLYEAGRLAESEQKFTELTLVPGQAGTGFYGLGMVRLAQGDRAGAEHYFGEALRRGPAYANAQFQLAALAEKAGEVSRATALYRHTLELSPQHYGALQRLKVLAPAPASDVPLAGGHLTSDSQSTRAGQTNRLRHGVYDVLLQDDSALSRETLAVIDSLEFDAIPRFVAYSRRVSLAIALFIISFVLLLSPQVDSRRWGTGPYQLDPALVAPINNIIGLGRSLLVIAVLFGFVLAFVDVKVRRYVNARGRLQVHAGLTRRRVTNLELWRVQDIELDRTLLNQLTRDGTLTFHVIADRGNKVVRLTGIARGQRLDDMFQQFLNLVFLLRSNPAVKGIIY